MLFEALRLLYRFFIRGFHDDGSGTGGWLAGVQIRGREAEEPAVGFGAGRILFELHEHVPEPAVVGDGGQMLSA